MKKKFRLLLISIVIGLCPLLLIACSGIENPPAEHKIIRLLVTGDEKIESADWDFDQFLAHASAERDYSGSGTLKLANLYRWDIGKIYIRTMNLNTREVTHRRSINTLQMEANEHIEFAAFENFLFPRNLLNLMIDETVTIFYWVTTPMERLTIRLRVLRSP